MGKPEGRLLSSERESLARCGTGSDFTGGEVHRSTPSSRWCITYPYLTSRNLWLSSFCYPFTFCFMLMADPEGKPANFECSFFILSIRVLIVPWCSWYIHLYLNNQWSLSVWHSNLFIYPSHTPHTCHYSILVVKICQYICLTLERKYLFVSPSKAYAHINMRVWL